MRTASRASLVLSLMWGCGVGEPGEAPIRRLTPTEYNNSVRDLFGIGPNEWTDEEQPYGEEGWIAAWPWVFPPDVRLGGFEGMAEGQVVSPYHVETVQRAAEHFAKYTVQAPRFWTCETPGTLTDDDRRACARESVVRLAFRAWRRPLTADEQTRLTTAFDGWADQHGTDAAIELVTQALLQSPAFLYLPETTGRACRSCRRSSSRAGSRTRSGIRCPTPSCSKRPTGAG